ncbi:MAG: putative amidohydrolase YtcJ, partial [Gammaproteobacteria bacterium]
LIHPDDIPRFKALDVIANFQALWAIPDDYIMKLNLPVVGQERVDRMYPIGSMVKSGARIVGGSDWSVSSLNPIEAIHTGVNREDPSGEEAIGILTPEERVDLKTMIEAYTINGAYLMHQEDITGSIEVGKYADLIVLDRNLFEHPANEIYKAKVLHTFLEGQAVYSAE